MAGWIIGFLLIVFGTHLVVRTVLDFKQGLASLKFKWTWPQIEIARVDEPVRFWLLILIRLVLAVTVAWLGVMVVIAS